SIVRARWNASFASSYSKLWSAVRPAANARCASARPSPPRCAAPSVRVPPSAARSASARAPGASHLIDLHLAGVEEEIEAARADLGIADAQHDLIAPRDRRAPDVRPQAPGPHVRRHRTVADRNERLVRPEADQQRAGRFRSAPHDADDAVERTAGGD